MDEVRFARVGDASVAYAVSGEPGAHDVVLMMGGTTPMSAIAEDEVGARLLESLQGVGRVVLFDRRGIGTSDPIEDWSRPLSMQWADDLLAVMDAAGLESATVMAVFDCAPAVLAASAEPERFGGMILYQPSRFDWNLSDDPAEAVHEEVLSNIEGEGDWPARFCPTRADDPTFRGWFTQSGQTGASPAVARRLLAPRTPAEIDVLTAAVADLAVPIQILRRPEAGLITTDVGAEFRASFPGAEQVELPGRDLFILGEELDALLSEVTRFITGEAHVLPARRITSVVMFTDLVDSTALARSLGDHKWRAILERHDRLIRTELERCGGRLVKTMGDGVLALLPSASAALKTADSIRQALGEDGLSVRTGIHVGDVDQRGDDVSGLAVNIAARIMAEAGPGQILLSESAVLAAIGDGADFAEIGRRTLKGLPGEWTIYSAP